MKQFFFLLFALIINSINAQIGIINETKMIGHCGTGLSEIRLIGYPMLEYTTDGQEGYYTISYMEGEYVRVKKNFSFSATKNELKRLQKFFLDGFVNSNDRSLKVGNNTLYVSVTSMCDDCIYVTVNRKGTFKITKECANQLFRSIN